MKFTNTTLSGLIAASLLGCVPVDESADLDQVVREEAARLATQRAEEDKRELQQALAQAKARDPKVVDVYYTISPTGERQLNVVRESEQIEPTATTSGNNQDTFTYALAGMAAGMFMANMMNNTNSYSNSLYRSGSSSYYSGSPADTERRKRSGVATYVATSNAAISNRVYSQARSGAFRSASGRSVSTSKGAFSGAGARSGSVGG